METSYRPRCRLCLREDKTLMSVFQFKNGHKISEMIQIICSITICKKDNYSKKTCMNCLATVCKAHELRILSMKNEQYLKESETRVFVKLEQNVDDLIKYEPSPSTVELNNSDEDNSIRDFSENTSYDIVEVSMQHEFFSENSTEAFYCDQCSEIKSSKQAIERHMKAQHSSSNVCEICSKKFISTTLLKKHKRRTHSSIDSFSCENCDLIFNSKRKLAKHQELHSFFVEETDEDLKYFQCRFCPKRFTSLNDKIFEHISQHKKKLKCIESPGKRRPEVKRIREEHESLVCPHCGQIYRTKQILQQHIKRHFATGDKYPCPKCPMRFKSFGELYYHNAVHTTVRNFVCEICSKAFKAKRDLRNHKIRHETKDVKKFQCQHCQLKLKSKYTLNRHILIHTGEKKFQCTYCQKPFTQKNELNKHLRIHIGENTYKCEESGCSEAFRLLAELRLHQQIHYDKVGDN